MFSKNAKFECLRVLLVGYQIMFLPKSHVEVLNASETIFGDRTLKEVIRLNEVMWVRLPLITEKETPEFTLYSLAHRGKIMWGHREGSHLQAKKRGLARNQDCWLLDLGCWINFCCLSPSVCGILLWQPELIHISLW